RLPFDVLHRDERTTVGLAHVEDAHDVRVREPRGQSRLPEKASPELLVAREVLREALQRHRPVELDVANEVDGRHSAVSKWTDELVAPGDPRFSAQCWFPLPSPCPWWSCGLGGFGFGPF